MRFRHSVEKKFEMVVEALTDNTTQAELCRRYGIFPTQLARWWEQFIKEDKNGLSSGRHSQSMGDTLDVQNKIMIIDPEKQKPLKINKSILWYLQRRIKESKIIEMYN